MVETTVIQKFQECLGTSDDLPLTSRVYDDLGLDSITFVVVLLDLSDHFHLDLREAEVDLATLQTLEDVAALLRASPEDDGVPAG